MYLRSPHPNLRNHTMYAVLEEDTEFWARLTFPDEPFYPRHGLNNRLVFLSNIETASLRLDCDEKDISTRK